MSFTYHQITERSLDRIAGLSDGVFAFAVTLIVFEIHVPDPGPIGTEAQLASALFALAPRFVTYLLSLLTLGIFWSVQQTHLQYVSRADRKYMWIQLIYLAGISTLPFTTSLLAEFIGFRLALVIYWLNIVVLGWTLLWAWFHARSAGLLREEATADVTRAIWRRTVVAQLLYALGASLAIANTYFSIGFIVLVQLYYALGLGPRIPLLRRTVIGRS